MVREVLRLPFFLSLWLSRDSLRYSTPRSHFVPFALVAALLWQREITSCQIGWNAIQWNRNYWTKALYHLSAYCIGRVCPDPWATSTCTHACVCFVRNTKMEIRVKYGWSLFSVVFSSINSRNVSVANKLKCYRSFQLIAHYLCRSL